jgi:hypothetical protein
MEQKTVWTWEGKDQGLNKILQDIDKSIVKIEKDSAGLEQGLTKAMKGSARSVDYLRDRMKRLEDIRNNVFDEKKIAKYNNELRKTEAQINRLQSLGQSRGQRFSSAMSEMPFGNQLLGFAASPYALAGFGAMATGALVNKSVGYTRNINAEMAKINATAQMSPDRIMALRDSFYTTANKIGVDVNTLPSAYEGIISATGDKGMADKLFDPALKLAKAGFTDASITGRALSQITMTPGVNMTETQIADMLMAAKNFGKGELSDFANYLPGLISTGKLRGFKEQDVTGAYSYLTRSNSAEQASTLMSNFMNVVLRKDVTDEIRKRLKIDVFKEDGSLKNMGNIIGDLGGAMNGLSDKGKQSFLDAIKVVDQQAFQALGALTANSGDLNKAIETVTYSAGVLNKTLELSKTGNEELVVFNNNFSLLLKNIGSALLPIINPVLKGVNNNFSNIAQALPGGTALKAAYDISGYFTGRNAEEAKRKQSELDQNKVSWIQDNVLKAAMDKYSNLSPEDQLQKSFLEIKNKVGTKFMGQDFSAPLWETLKGFQKNRTSTGAPDGKTDFIGTPSQGADEMMRDYKQVRNVTITIQNLQKIDNVAVGSAKDLAELTGEDLLNGFIKIVRDAEQTLNTY